MNTKVKTVSLRATKWRGNLFRDCFVGILFLLAMTGYASPAFAGELANQFTVSLWVNPITSVASKALAVKNTEIRLYTDASGYANCAIHNGTSWQTAAADTAALPLNTWSFVSCTYDKTTLRIFVGGVQKGTSALTVTVNDAATNWRVGSDEAGTYGDLTGTTDEFKIYNYARTAKQIVSDMNGGHPAGGSPVGSQVGYWKFDEGYGTVANNSGSAGSALNGTLTAMASPATSTSGWSNSGKFGKGLAFDGSNDSVIVTDNSALNPSSITVSTWVKTSDATANFRGVVDKKHSGVGGYLIYIYSGTPRFSVINGGTNQDINSGINVSDNVWHHIVATHDATSGTQSIYIDGIFKASATGKTMATTGTAGLYINGDGADTSSMLSAIDEVKIYNYALTSDEVKTEFNQGVVMSLGTKGTNSSYAANAENQTYCIPGSSDPCNPPVGEWNFDEGSGNANDTSGNGNTGTWAGTGNHWTSGKFGKAGGFNATDDYVNIPNSSSLQFTTSFTAEGWFYITSTTQNGVMGLLSQSGGAQTWKWFTGSGYGGGVSTEFHATGGSIAPSFGTVSLNTWEHYAETYDGSSVKLYKNGRLISTTSLTGNMLSPTNNIAIGCDNYSCSGRYYKGSIDQVRIFNYARTPAQIAWDYNRGKPVGWWKMDECSGGTANDSSGNGNSGTITIGATGTQTATGNCQSANSAHAWNNGATGKFNSSLNFDGTDDYVEIANESNFDFSNGVFSVEAWVKSTASAWNPIFSKRSDPGGNNAWEFTITGGLLNLTFAGINDYTAVSGFVNDGAWHHVVAVLSGNNGTVKFFKDGVQVDSKAIGTVSANNLTAKIGYSVTTGTYFSGQLDDVRVYNYALTATQIKTLFNGNGSVRFGP